MAVADAENTDPWQTESVGVVTTVGALVILIVISLESDMSFGLISTHKLAVLAVNVNVTEFDNKSVAEKLYVGCKAVSLSNVPVPVVVHK